MQRPIYKVLSLFILIAILLTACGGQETVASRRHSLSLPHKPMQKK